MYVNLYIEHIIYQTRKCKQQKIDIHKSYIYRVVSLNKLTAILLGQKPFNASNEVNIQVNNQRYIS